MLPIYQAISFHDFVKGGRTTPWTVIVKTEEGIKPYITKFFQREQEEARHSVVNEVLGNVLAGEFDLNVPAPALIELSEDFRMTLDARQQSFLDGRDDRIKFGCELIDGAQLFSHSLEKYLVRDRLSIETLFAFDVLIRNRDRNNGKPNLLIHDSSASLIDHELAFELVDNDAIQLMRDGQVDNRFTDTHIFLPYLKKARPMTKASYFENFTYFLQNLNLGKLNPYLTQLHNQGYETNREQLIDYLNAAKENSVRFVNSLKAVTQ